MSAGTTQLASADNSTSLWDRKYQFYIDQQIEVAVFLANGIRLNGVILDFDDSAVVLTSEHKHPEGVTVQRAQVATLMRKPVAKDNQHQPQETRTGHNARR